MRSPSRTRSPAWTKGSDLHDRPVSARSRVGALIYARDMRERLKQVTAVTALVLVAGGSLVACSDKSDPKADGAETSGATLTQVNFFDELRKSLVEAGSSHVKMSVEAAGQVIKADGESSIGKTPADSAMALTMDAGQAGLGTAEMRLVYEIVYVNLGP